MWPERAPGRLWPRETGDSLMGCVRQEQAAHGTVGISWGAIVADIGKGCVAPKFQYPGFA
jgi:hypothetical protein